MIRESAPAKVNLILQVGSTRDDGLHELCSLFASIDLADVVLVRESTETHDSVACHGVPEPNIAQAALRAFRAASGVALPPLHIEIDKRIPVAAGLGGGSADAAAVLRAANAIAGRPLEVEALRRVAVLVGADVASQIEPGHAVVEGAGEVVEPVALPAIGLVLVPLPDGLSTGDVYREADRIGATRARLSPDSVRAAARRPVHELAGALENDLEAAALSLRPALAGRLDAVRSAGALGALVSGSGPTVVGVFEDPAAAGRAAERLPGAITAALR